MLLLRGHYLERLTQELKMIIIFNKKEFFALKNH